jgi:hypothetical protein
LSTPSDHAFGLNAFCPVAAAAAFSDPSMSKCASIFLNFVLPPPSKWYACDVPAAGETPSASVSL